VKVVSVKTFPSDDLAFAAHVARAQERVGTWDAPPVLALLRQAYPDVSARRAFPGALLDEGTDCWYVFRDGAVYPPATLDDQWADDASLPRVLVGPDGRYVDANGAAAQLFGVPRERIIGSLAGSFTAHEADDELGKRLLHLASDDHPVRSVAIVKHPIGDVRIEFVVRPSGKDSHAVTMRPIAPRPESKFAESDQADIPPGRETDANLQSMAGPVGVGQARGLRQR